MYHVFLHFAYSDLHSSAGITGLCHHTFFFIHVAGIKARITCILDKHPTYQLSYAASPSLTFQDSPALPFSDFSIAPGPAFIKIMFCGRGESRGDSSKSLHSYLGKPAPPTAPECAWSLGKSPTSCSALHL